MLLNHKEIKEDIKDTIVHQILRILNKESKMHKVEPWNKLDKTTKVKKLEKYADKLKEDNKLTKEELAHLVNI